MWAASIAPAFTVAVVIVVPVAMALGHADKTEQTDRSE